MRPLVGEHLRPSKNWDPRTSSGVTVEVKSVAYAAGVAAAAVGRSVCTPHKQAWEPSANESRDLPEPQRPAVAYRQRTTCRDVVGRS